MRLGLQAGNDLLWFGWSEFKGSAQQSKILEEATCKVREEEQRLQMRWEEEKEAGTPGPREEGVSRSRV